MLRQVPVRAFDAMVVCSVKELSAVLMRFCTCAVPALSVPGPAEVCGHGVVFRDALSNAAASTSERSCLIQ